MSKTEVQAEATGAGKKKGRLLIVIGAVVGLVAGGVGAWLLLGAEEPEDTEVKAVAKAPPTFFTLDPFVVNLAGEAQHYLQVGIDLKIADEHVKDLIKVHLPEIRNGVLLLLSSKQIDELSTLEGKNRLRAEIRDAVNQPLGIHAAAVPAAVAPAEGGTGEAHAAPGAPAATAEPPAEGVLEVLLTSFVIQ
jgi:flagellar FliL protein